MLAEPQQAIERLLAWLASNQRDLPWRRDRSPYSVLVSEIMLQQTQVSTVIPYYLRFMEAFPDLCTLAAAPLDRVLAQWRGLGYYARARSLHRAAIILCDEYEGVLPDDPAILRTLPGIGEYTAGAILSIAFGQDVPAVDANVARVLSRLCDDPSDPRTPAGKRRLVELARALLPLGRTGAFNEAMMELGALVCSSAAPRCELCPLAGDCLALERGTIAQRPVTSSKKERPTRQYVCLLDQADGRVLLVRRLTHGLLGGLWELPGGELLSDEDARVGIARILADDLSMSLSGAEVLGKVRHGYTHFTVEVAVLRGEARGTPQPTGGWDAWVRASEHDLPSYGLTGVATRALALAGIVVARN